MEWTLYRCKTNGCAWSQAGADDWETISQSYRLTLDCEQPLYISQSDNMSTGRHFASREERGRKPQVPLGSFARCSLVEQVLIHDKLARSTDRKRTASSLAWPWVHYPGNGQIMTCLHRAGNKWTGLIADSLDGFCVVIWPWSEIGKKKRAGNNQITGRIRVIPPAPALRKR